MFEFFGLMILFLIAAFIFRRFRKKSSPYFRQELSQFLSHSKAMAIVSPEQITQLLNLSIDEEKISSSQSSSKNALIIGAMFVLGGLSLLIAHNWEQISPLTRIISFVSAHIILSYIYLVHANQKPWLKTVLELVLFFMPILGISLFAQTFHLSGDPIRPFLVWAVLVFPLVFYSQSKILPCLLIVLLLATLFSGNIINSMLSIHGPGRLMAWVLSTVIWLMLTWCFRQTNASIQSLRFTFFAGWLFLLSALETPLHLNRAQEYFLLALSLSILSTVASLHESKGLKKHHLSAWIWIGLIYLATFLWHASSDFNMNKIYVGSNLGLIFLGLVTLSTLATALFYPFTVMTHESNLRLSVRACLVISLALSGFCFLPYSYTRVMGISFMANLLLFVMASCLIWMGKKQHHQSMINIGLGILVLLLVSRFIDIFGNMILSGAGLVVSGLFLIGLGYFLSESKKRIGT